MNANSLVALALLLVALGAGVAAVVTMTFGFVVLAAGAMVCSRCLL